MLALVQNVLAKGVFAKKWNSVNIWDAIKNAFPGSTKN